MTKRAIEEVAKAVVERLTKAEIEKHEHDARLAAEKGDPSRKVMAERELFSAKCFKGGGQGHHSGDAIGQLWLCGLLDVPDMDETNLLEAVRTWWRGKGESMPEVDYSTQAYERASRSTGSARLGKYERAYYRYNDELKNASKDDREALFDLMHEDSVSGRCAWAMRLVKDNLLSRLIMPHDRAGFADSNDWNLLAAAKRAMVAMAGKEAKNRRRAA